MSAVVRHSGVVMSTNGSTAQIRITQSSACASCQVSKHCSIAESKDKIVEVSGIAEKLMPGDEVFVSTSQQMAWMAIMIGFSLPLFLLIIVLLWAKWIGATDQTAALLSLGTLIPYYILVWFFQRIVSQKIRFFIEKL